EDEAHVVLRQVSILVERARRDGGDAHLGGEVAAGLDVVAEAEAVGEGAGEVGALGGRDGEAGGAECFHEEITAAQVGGPELLEVRGGAGEGGRGGVLQGGGRREGDELVGALEGAGEG